MRSERTGILLKKNWHIVTTNAGLASLLSRRCSNRLGGCHSHEHQTIEGVETPLSAAYPEKMVAAIAKYLAAPVCAACVMAAIHANPTRRVCGKQTIKMKQPNIEGMQATRSR